MIIEGNGVNNCIFFQALQSVEGTVDWDKFRESFETIELYLTDRKQIYRSVRN